MGLQVPLLAQEQSWAQSCPKCPPAHTVGTGNPGTGLPSQALKSHHPHSHTPSFLGHSYHHHPGRDLDGNLHLQWQLSSVTQNEYSHSHTPGGPVPVPFTGTDRDRLRAIEGVSVVLGLTGRKS